MSYEGAERRHLSSSDDKLILFRLDKIEETNKALQNDLGEVKKIVIEMKTGYSVMQNEMSHIAKDAGKTSGAISGVGTGIIMAIIGFILQMAFKQ